MTTLAFGHAAQRLAVSPAVLYRLVLAVVWVAVASSAVVFSEPAPVDLMMIGLVGLLPLLGLMRLTPMHGLLLAGWLVCAGAGFLAAPFAGDVPKAVTYNLVSLYLYVSAVVIAGFVALSPSRHARLVLDALACAALVAAAAGIVGSLGLVHGAAELFTKFGRAAGTFKDPNVLGAFLVAPAVYALHLLIERPLRRGLLPLAALAVFTFAILLSFSRGAWLSLALAVSVYGYLAFVTAEDRATRLRIAILAAGGIVAALAVVVVALQIDSVSALMAERASLTQSYDVGPDGRFGGQEKARGLILDNPLGIGAQEFTNRHHHEEVHNVFLSMFLNAGWIGGLTYIAMVALTLGLGLRHACRAHAARPLFLVVLAAFAGNAFEGIVIDSDHWRHFFLLMGLVWGLMAAPADADEEAGRALP